MAVRVQVAFQGGGARAAALLAAVDALQQAEAAGHIIVTRVAGASAGALAAAVYAARLPAAEVRERLQAIGDDGLTKLFPTLSWWRMAVRAFFGKPFYDIRVLRKLLLELLAPLPKSRAPSQTHAITKSTTFAELATAGIPCFVMVTSLNSSKGHLRGGASDPSHVIDALVDSAALPFAFRVAEDLHSSPFLDGGLCENLPTYALTEGAGEHGDVLALSFEMSEVMTPSNPKSLLFALFDLMINHAVSRATAGLSENSVGRIPTSLSTLDFGRMCEHGLAEVHYDTSRRYVTDWLKAWLPTATAIQPKSLSIEDYQKKLSFLCSSYGTEYVIHRSAIIVVVHFDSNLGSSIEEVYSITDFEPVAEPLRVFRTFVGSTTGTVGEANWRVWPMTDGKPSGEEIDPILLPLESDDHNRARPDVALFFTQPLHPNRCYRVETQARTRDSMKGLFNDTGTEFITNNVMRAEIAKVMDVVLALPKGVSVRGEPNRGRQLKPHEIAAAGYVIPQGFVAYGWRAEDFKAKGESIRVDFFRT